jgi:hypothetical protein
MKRLIPYLPLVFLLSGCAWAESMGLWDTATGAPTPTGAGLNETLRQLTGFDYLKMYGVVKGVEAVGTKKGLQNLANLVSPASSWKGTGWSLLSLLGVAHTPDEAKGEAPG